MDAYAVIPAYNEEKHILDVIERAKKQKLSGIIIVDDGSNDQTYKLAKTTGVIVLRHLVNLGKGAALKTGCEFAIKKGAEAIVVLDSDSQHKPEDIPRFIDALKEAGIVFGYREKTRKMPVVLKFGNWFIDTALKMLFSIKIKDTQSGYRAFTKNTYKKIRWDSQDYTVESEMIALTGKNRIKFKQIPIETIYIDRYKGTGVLDGMSIFMKMLWWRMTR